MGQRIGISKAARLLGIKRSELNKRLEAANIQTFEGEVDFEKVKCIAPSLEMKDPELDRIQRIRESASYAKPDDPDGTSQDLNDRVRRLSVEVAIEAEAAREYREIVEGLAAKLGELQASDNPERSRVGFELCEWLRNKANTE
jgi:hypothetical protein